MWHFANTFHVFPKMRLPHQSERMEPKLDSGCCHCPLWHHKGFISSVCVWAHTLVWWKERMKRMDFSCFWWICWLSTYECYCQKTLEKWIKMYCVEVSFGKQYSVFGAALGKRVDRVAAIVGGPNEGPAHGAVNKRRTLRTREGVREAGNGSHFLRQDTVLL